MNFTNEEYYLLYWALEDKIHVLIDNGLENSKRYEENWNLRTKLQNYLYNSKSE